jgi:beta-xylosidase
MRKFLLVLFICITSLSFSQTLVLPGDYPDPSVVKIGDTYWATATTSNWAPVFPLLSSKDLLIWETKSHVFTQLPAWADYYFWAPEITYDKGKVYVYYSAHKKGGNLCLGIASADKPEGPYRDHGPMMCQEAGSIDAFPMRDANGKLYLIWKEDGNSVKKPTPIWAMEMSEDRTMLLGEKVELFRNDSASWEANLVEGVSMLKHGEYYYAFYAGAGCCGRECTYGVGVARAKNLLGPWEKYSKNPLLKTNDEWKCPGHGTPIEHNGKFYFLYHAYDDKGSVYAGRQGVLSEFTFTSDGWIEFSNKELTEPKIPIEVIDEFNGTTLSSHWQSSVFQNIKYKLSNGKLQLNALTDKSGAILGQKTLTEDYEAEVILTPSAKSAEAGIALIGDEKNFISMTLQGNKLKVGRVQENKEFLMDEKNVSAANRIYLRIIVRNGKDINFEHSLDGKKYETINREPADGHFLPPWDRAVRVGIISRGEPGQVAQFEQFSLRNKK